MRKSSGDAEVGGKQWKSVEDKRKVRKTCGSWWKTRKGSEGVRKARKRSGRPWERAEEAGGLGKVTVRYNLPQNCHPTWKEVSEFIYNSSKCSQI